MITINCKITIFPYTCVIYINKFNNIEVENAELNTPLLMAAGEGSSEVMSILIKKGAKMSRTDGKGNKTVHLMVSSDNAHPKKPLEYI